jgi:Fe-S-cluster containining protein
MHCSNCGICCTQTEMLLSNRDIRRLEKKGYIKTNFVRYDKQGYAQLKNRDGFCVFYDRQNQLCSVYADRPTGCQIYPVIFDEEKGVVLDEICQSRATITLKEKIAKGKCVIKLLKRIDKEALKRSSRKNI